MSQLDISFEGFWQCRLATDPDPSDEQRGVSGFTYSVAGESLLEPSIWSQEKDILKEYGPKDAEFIDPLAKNEGRMIKNIREASPDHALYNERGIGLKVTQVEVNGEAYAPLAKLIGGLVRFDRRPQQPKWPWRGPIFEGRNQITSDGDPDRFTVNPFVFGVYEPNDDPDPGTDTLVLQRFDPLRFSEPDAELWQINPTESDFNDILERRLPLQRFALSNELLEQMGLDPNELDQYFVNRENWLRSKIMEAEANGQSALAESFKSRLFAVNFFTQSTGPTVLANRLLSRIPLRQLYHHTIRGDHTMQPAPFVNTAYFDTLTLDSVTPWDILYYMGGYDGDLMAGWCTGTLSIPVTVNS